MVLSTDMGRLREQLRGDRCAVCQSPTYPIARDGHPYLCWPCISEAVDIAIKKELSDGTTNNS